MNNTSEQAIEPQEDKTLRIMRSVVINMGILLFVGTIALFVAIFIKANSSDKEEVANVSNSSVVASIQESQVPEKKIVIENQAQKVCNEYNKADFSVMGNIISSDNNNGILTVTTSKQVMVFDLCKGRVIAKFQSVGS